MKNSKNTTATNNNNTNNVIELVENTNNVSLETKATETTEVTETKEVVFKEIDYSKTYKDVGINSINFQWNNVNTSIKSWNTPREQAFQSFRSSLFNDNIYVKNEVFKMLSKLCELDNLSIEKFRASDTRALHAHNTKLIEFKDKFNDIQNIDYNNCFTALEILDIKQRLYHYSYKYWYNVLQIRNWKNNNSHDKSKTKTTLNRISEKYDIKNLEILNEL